MHIVVRTNYPANARSTTIASHECGGGGGRWNQSEGDRVTTQPFPSWDGTGFPADECRNWDCGATSNQPKHAPPARLQRLRELNAGGRDVCTSDLRVEYTPEMVYPDTSQRKHTNCDIFRCNGYASSKLVGEMFALASRKLNTTQSRLQRLRELKAGGREVGTSELRVEYAQIVEGNLNIWGGSHTSGGG